jgi:hypothetical protein
MLIIVRRFTALAAIAAVGALSGVAHADSRPLTISPVAPIQQVAGQGLTDSPTFSLLVQATAGTTLTCSLDSEPVGCGPTPPTCAGTVCAVFTATGEPQGNHDLDVTDTDAAGDTVDQNDYPVAVDLTPPQTSDLVLKGGDPHVLRPAFTFDVEDDTDLSDGDVVDSGQCSFTPVAEAPVWSPCPPDKDEQSPEHQYTASVPAKHVDYVFRGRAVDAFGRADPDPVSMHYDPVPCTVKVTSPHTVRKLLGTGMDATVQCTGTQTAALTLYLLGTNGHAVPLHQALRGYPLIAPVDFKARQPVFTARRELRLSDILISADKTIAHARSLRLAVAVHPGMLGLPDTAQFTITVPGQHKDQRRTPTGSGR